MSISIRIEKHHTPNDSSGEFLLHITIFVINTIREHPSHTIFKTPLPTTMLWWRGERGKSCKPWWLFSIFLWQAWQLAGSKEGGISLSEKGGRRWSLHVSSLGKSSIFRNLATGSTFVLAYSRHLRLLVCTIYFVVFLIISSINITVICIFVLYLMPYTIYWSYSLYRIEKRIYLPTGTWHGGQ